MKRILLLLAIFAAAVLSSSSHPPAAKKDHASAFKKETYVFICNSNGAYAYHSSKTCRGLNRCTHEILKVTLSEAVNTYKRRACKICE